MNHLFTCGPIRRFSACNKETIGRLLRIKNLGGREAPSDTPFAPFAMLRSFVSGYYCASVGKVGALAALPR